MMLGAESLASDISQCSVPKSHAHDHGRVVSKTTGNDAELFEDKSSALSSFESA